MINLLYNLLVVIPEETILLVISLFIMGKREYMSFKSKENIFKMVYAVGFTALFSILLNDTIQKYAYMFVVRTFFFALVYCLVYKANFFKALIGFIAALTIYISGEYIGMKITEFSTGINHAMLETEYVDTYIYFILLLPRKILQLAFVLVLYRVNRIYSLITEKAVQN